MNSRCLYIMWHLIALVAAVAIPGPVKAQTSETADRDFGLGAFLELAGNSLLGATANLEILFDREVGARVGYGADIYTLTRVVPVQIVYLIGGGGNSKLELALGVTIASEGEYTGNWRWDGTQPFVSGFFGYRYHRPHGFLFRIGIIPMTWTNRQLPWLALSFGTTF